MKHPCVAISAALAATVLLASATIVPASLSQPQAVVPAGSNIATKADLELPASVKGDLLPIKGRFAPVKRVMVYQTSPRTSTVLPLPSIALAD